MIQNRKPKCPKIKRFDRQKKKILILIKIESQDQDDTHKILSRT